MSNKQNIKDIFEEKLNKERIHQKIIMKVEEKKSMKRNLWKFAIPVCAIIVICGIAIMTKYDSKPIKLKPPLQEANNTDNKNNIVINDIGNMGLAKIDADVEILSNINSSFDILTKLKVAIDLINKNCCAIYVKSNSNKYDKLNNYEFWYYNEDNTRNVKIAFSDTNIPLRDYYIGDKNEKSTINNIDLLIYQYEDMYMTTFKYNGYNFDIETSGLTQDELIATLESIIQ